MHKLRTMLQVAILRFLTELSISEDHQTVDNKHVTLIAIILYNR